MSFEALAGFVDRAERLFVITGAGISAPSGIDTYRDHAGEWRRSAPIQHQDFLCRHVVRQRYWARSMRGWPAFRDARPNPAHDSLAVLESMGRVRVVVTQNVDGLHQRAGQQRVIELHGSLDRARCVACGSTRSRGDLQEWLEKHNGAWLEAAVAARPDGDAEFLSVRQFADFTVPSCHCGGILKPDVVFYGDSVPKPRVEQVYDELRGSDAVLVVGSSLMVYSSFRFLREARSRSLPLAAVNIGLTRADGWLHCKWEADGAQALPALVSALGTHCSTSQWNRESGEDDKADDQAACSAPADPALEPGGSGADSVRDRCAGGRRHRERRGRER